MKCKHCDSTDLRPHCGGKVCTWLRCNECSSVSDHNSDDPECYFIKR